MSLIHEAVDGVVPDCPGCTRSPTGMASPDARLIQQLHDGPAQWMTLALLKMDRALGADCVVDAHLLHNVRMLLDEALHGIRYVLDDWGGGEAVEPMSLTAALTDLGHRLVSLTGLTLHLECDDRVTDPPASVTAIVLHAAQELLLNTCKYAPGAKAEMLLAADMSTEFRVAGVVPLGAGDRDGGGGGRVSAPQHRWWPRFGRHAGTAGQRGWLFQRA